MSRPAYPIPFPRDPNPEHGVCLSGFNAHRTPPEWIGRHCVSCANMGHLYIVLHPTVVAQCVCGCWYRIDYGATQCGYGRQGWSDHDPAPELKPLGPLPRMAPAPPQKRSRRSRSRS